MVWPSTCSVHVCYTFKNFNHNMEVTMVQKKVTLVVRQTEISKIFTGGFQLLLEDNASVLDAIKAVDEEIKRKCEKFPVKTFKSLLHMVYNVHENRFYKQVAAQAYTISKAFLDVRENPKMPLPNETTIILVPQGGCQTDWEEPIDC